MQLFTRAKMIRLLLDLSFYSIVTVLILIAFICAITTDKLGQQVTTAMALVILAPLYVVYQIVRLGMVDEPARPRSSSVTLSRPLDKVFVFEQSAETLTRSLIQQVRTYEDQSFDLCVSSGCSRKFQVQVLPKQKNASVNFTLDCEVVPLSDGSEARFTLVEGRHKLEARDWRVLNKLMLVCKNVCLISCE